MSEKVVDIYDISYEGAGVGRIDGQVVFVPKTLKNEKVRVKVTKQLSTFLLAKVEEVILPSEKRIVPRCQYFEVCGGCDFQHCDAEEEKRIKLEIIKKEIIKAGYIGEIGFEESCSRFSYRNKVKFEVVDGKLGYFKSKSRDFFEVERCEIASEKMNELLPVVKDFISKNKFLGLKSVYFKEVDESFAICFLFSKGFEKAIKQVKSFKCFEGCSVFFAFGDVLESNSTKILNLFGNSKLIKKVGGLPVEVEVSAFNQVNDDIAEKLYSYIEMLCQDKRVINAYSGQGLLTYRIAEKAKFVYGIEYQLSAHEIAERLCSHCGVYKIENVCGKVEDRLKGILMRDRVDTIVLDPAREGCQKTVLEEILNFRLQEVIYVSCNFSTLIRDLKLLNEFYYIESVKIFNMFPCCVNMETVVILRRKG